MQIIMNDTKDYTIEKIENFLKGSEKITFNGKGQADTYKWIQTALIKFQYISLKKQKKSLVKLYIQKITGYSRAQVTRYIKQYVKTGYVRKTQYKRSQFSKKYGPKDIALLAKTDKLHNLSGPAIKRILEREFAYGNTAYRSISKISVAHLYNLRKSSAYQLHHHHYSKTNPVSRDIAERQKPRPNGKPGFIRIDTVHQGDKDGEKGVYHINAVDEVTQWEIIISVEKISELYMTPVLKEILTQFPFVIVEFHSDNGSEFINHNVAELLNKLIVKFTKSRARKTNDNALVESKNGHVVRKQFGYAHISQKHADQLNLFNRGFLNRYINFHRPCFFPVEKVDHKGKIHKTYPYEALKTPYECFSSIPDVATFLKKEITLAKLKAIANQYSDNQFAEILMKAKQKLWESISQ